MTGVHLGPSIVLESCYPLRLLVAMAGLGLDLISLQS